MNKLKYLYYMYYRPKIFFSRKSYSMYGEDLIINNFFKKKKKGFYVDGGCYHPIDGSNTHLLFRRGWEGINIDVNSLSIDLFKAARKNDKNVNIAVSSQKKKIKIYYRKKINMLNTSSKKLAQIHFRNGYYKKSVNSDTLNSILQNSRFKDKKIDFLNLDVEGNELNVLKSLNFKKYRPELICVEIHNQEDMYNHKTDYLKRNNIYKFLIKKKYNILWKSGFSFIFK